MHGSKLIDLRDCQSPEFEVIYRQMQRIQVRTSGTLARWAFTVFGKADKLKPIWSRRWEYPWAILAADLRPGLRALDAGCGASPLLRWLASEWSGLSLYGVDKGPETHDATTWKVKLLQTLGYVPIEGFHPGLDHRIQLRQESITQMSFQNGFFDRVFCISVIEHLALEERGQAMSEMARVLKPGGRLLVTVDLPPDDSRAAEGIVEASGLQLLGSLDYSVSRSLRHGHTYEVGGLALSKS
jgi:2-polyprenyl-3-methyl-5-hydroxy-6-metoxy-1,4-benzoquinol methylase